MKWIKIPGYESYVICKETLQIKNIVTGNIMSRTHGSVRLSCKGKQKNYTPQRLLYCAVNGYDVDKVPNSIIVAKDENGELKAYTRKDFSSKLIFKSNKTRKFPSESYHEIKNFIEIVLRYQDTGKTDELITTLYGYEEKAVRYCINNRYVCNESEALELVDMAIEKTVSNIVSGNIVVYPFKYIVSIVKLVKRELNKRKRIEKSLEDIRIYEKKRII